MSVIDEIAAERRRQIEAEGWTPEHDDTHGDGSLAAAAAAYAEHAADWARAADFRTYPRALAPRIWPWSTKWWKPKDRRRDLIRAAALIVAEVERLDRATPRTGTEERGG